MKAKYEKYRDNNSGEYKYLITLPDGTEHWCSIEVGNYMHQLEQQL